MKRRIIIVLVLLIAAGGYASWHFGVLERFGLVDAEPEVPTLYGNVDIRQVELGFRVSGRISEMRFDEGDSVTEGAILARLDPQPFLDSIALAEAEVGASTAQLDLLVRGARPQEIEQARAVVEEQKAALANAEQLVDRRVVLRKQGHVSQQAYDDAVAARDEARARLQAAQESLKLVTAGSRVEEIDAAAANLAAANAKLDTAKTALADTDLKAPADGIILSRVREPGAIVAAGATVYTLSLVNPVWIRAYIGEPDLGRIHPGMKVEIYTDTTGDKPYHGQIGFISPVAEFTPKSVETPELRSDLVYRLRVVVKDADKRLRQGMPVTIRLPEAETAARQ